jgi:hypothetical protein
MTEGETVSTWDVLRDFGFKPDAEVYSDVNPGLSFDFGNFKLSASCVMNLRLAKIVLFSGVLKTGRTIAEVSFEMPRRVHSQKQCAAWIVWHLDRSAGKGGLGPNSETAWIIEGRGSKNLLPWVR